MLFFVIGKLFFAPGKDRAQKAVVITKNNRLRLEEASHHHAQNKNISARHLSAVAVLTHLCKKCLFYISRCSYQRTATFFFVALKNISPKRNGRRPIQNQFSCLSPPAPHPADRRLLLFPSSLSAVIRLWWLNHTSKNISCQGAVQLFPRNNFCGFLNFRSCVAHAFGVRSAVPTYGGANTADHAPTFSCSQASAPHYLRFFLSCFRSTPHIHFLPCLYLSTYH